MAYEVVKEIGSYTSGAVQRESHLVKLGATALCRASKTFDLYEVDYVIVEALTIVDEGDVYEETHIVASDENGTPHDAVLYQATRALTLPEAMFAIAQPSAPDAEYLEFFKLEEVEKGEPDGEEV